MEKRSLLYIGKFYSPIMLKTIKEDSKGSIAFATHNFEMSMLNGFLSHEDLNITAISVPSIYSYPKFHKKWFIKGESYKIGRASVISLGFINLPIFKDIWRTISMFFTLFNYIYKRNENITRVYVSNPSSYFLSPIYVLKHIFHKKIEVTLLIMDIPEIIEEMDEVKGFRKWLMSAVNNNTMRMVEKCDNLVLLTESMMEFVAKDIPHIIVEGIVDVASMSKEYQPLSKGDKEIILYSGTLRTIFGVRNLIDAFELAKLENAELWICGSGDSKDYIEERAKINENIKFFGLVDAKIALEMQTKATILVNPRTSEGRYTRYSFPSKTMEYLLAGKSVIINKLPGIPEEYYKFVYIPNDESIVALANVLKKVVNTPFEERQEKSQKGRNYVITHKNSYIQSKRVLDLIFKEV